MPSTASRIVIRAGAGAGKTTVLIEQFLKYVLEFEGRHQKLPRVVVTTFTRKATQEIRERLMKKALEMGREELVGYLGNSSKVHISTIHGVLFSFLNRYGHFLDLSGQIQVKEDGDFRLEEERILRRLIGVHPDFFNLLEEIEWKTLSEFLRLYFVAAMEYRDLRPIQKTEISQFMSDEWSGKLKALERICHKIILEFVGRQEKWRDYLDLLLAKVEETSKLPLEVRREKWKKFFEQNRKPNFLKNKAAFSEELHDAFLEILNTIKDFSLEWNFDPQLWDQHESVTERLGSLASEYCKKLYEFKTKHLIFSMSDLELFSQELCQKSPEALRGFQNDWDFWMVDEYQDTSPIQNQLLNQFIGETPAFFVGDPQQSIYLFRGARSELFLDRIEEAQRDPLSHVSYLLKNYRSEPLLLEFFNAYFVRPKTQFEVMEPREKVDGWPSGRDQVHPIQICFTKNEMGFTLRRIQELLGEGVAPSEIAVLFRTHDLLDDFARECLRSGLPIQIHGGSHFQNKSEIKDVGYMFKFLHNPHDNLNLLCLLRSPWFHLADEKLGALVEVARSKRQKSYWRALQDLGDPVGALLKSYLLRAQRAPIPILMMSMLEESGLLWSCYRRDSGGGREANILKWITLLHSNLRRPGFQGLEFLEKLEKEEHREAIPVVEPRKVNLMTIHASKGLQFDYVLIPGMGQSIQKSKGGFFLVEQSSQKWTIAIMDPENQKSYYTPLGLRMIEGLRRREAQESERVLYVAMTRAKKGLSLISNVDVKSGSWASEICLNLEAGRHRLAQTEYVVRRENGEELADLIGEATSAPSGAPTHTPKGTPSLLSTSVISAPPSASTMISHRGKFDLLPPTAEEYLIRAQRRREGVVIHRELEKWKYQGITPDWLQDLFQQHRDLPLADIMREGEVEWGYHLMENGVLCEGRVDLWALLENRLYVVDYKTGGVEREELGWQQLQEYAHALCVVRALDPKQIILILLYTRTKKIMVRNLR